MIKMPKPVLTPSARDPSGDLVKKTFFIEIPIASQLQALFAQVSIWDMVTTYRFRRERTEDILGEIYDGTLYRKHWESGFLKGARNISVLYNTDGVPIFKSSKFSLWPIYLAINELPYSERFRRDNMLLASVWFGPDKPFMLTFLKPFHGTFHQLEATGVDIANLNGDMTTVRAILLCGTCDLPARCLVCNSIQFNGYYGCIRCRQSRQLKRQFTGTMQKIAWNRISAQANSHIGTEEIVQTLC